MGEAAEAPRRPVVRLHCSVQCYDWGRFGKESKVARLFERNSGSEIDARRPYAELWMGTHDSGPSCVALDAAGELGGEKAEALSLKEWIRRNPSVLGEKVVDKWGNDLPFLFKVLSVAKALSIQAHPDKESARFLHKTRPNIYKDSNHKPEMAIALSEFRALCGFVGNEELKDVLVGVPEIREIVGDEDARKVICDKELYVYSSSKVLLQSVFTKLMSTSNETVSHLVTKLKARLNTERKIRTLTEKEELVLLLEKQYQVDVGVLAAFFFNYIKLNPGEALYIGPNEPHAYLSGECIECMATSDNVVRAGLTPKFIDVKTLCSMLTYKQDFPEIFQGRVLNRYVTRYTPPADEFEVDHCSLPSKETSIFSAIPGPSIFVVASGKGRMQIGSAKIEEQIEEGDVYFVPAQNEFRLSAAADGPLQLYRAGVNSSLFDQRMPCSSDIASFGGNHSAPKR